jgi:hypothetical protein
MTDCLSPFELVSSEPLSHAQTAHLRSCRRCTALTRALGQASAAMQTTEPASAIEWPHRPVVDIDADPRPGAVHSIWGGEDGDLLAAVIVDVDDHEALVIPVSPETHLAAENDVLIDQRVLAYPAMLEVWNHAQVLREQIMERIGELDEQLTALVQDAVDAVIDGRGLPDGLPRGVPIIGEADPRRLFREEEALRTQRFVTPWRLLYAADTLGGVLASARAERELEPDAIVTQVDLSSDVLTRVEADEQDLRQSVPIPVMGTWSKRRSLPTIARPRQAHRRRWPADGAASAAPRHSPPKSCAANMPANTRAGCLSA